jgi:hypothetical protein
MMKRYPDSPVWNVEMRHTGRKMAESGGCMSELTYDENSFDLLFVTTPTGDYLIEWKALCQERGKVPSNIVLGQQMEKYRVA